MDPCPLPALMLTHRRTGTKSLSRSARCKMLGERHRFNKARKFGKGSILLNTPELDHLNSDVDLLTNWDGP
eukprot:scaffold8298_cov23-Tisochrysis_lutea.AAC.1